MKFAGACAIYGAAALALFYRPGLVDGAGYFGSSGDPTLFIWMFRFLPEAVLHLQNPFILPQAWAPYGLNITQATTTPLLALLAWPLTAVVGPLVSFNLVTLATPALAAAAAYLLVAQLTKRFAPAFIGGWLFGFSTAVFGPMLGHLHTDFVTLIPLAFLVLLLRAQGRLSFKASAACLSVLMVAQFLISLETFVTLAMFLAIYAAVADSLKVGGIRNLWHVSRDNLLAVVLASLVVTVIVTLPFSYYFFADYGQVPHELQNGSYYAMDLLNVLVPTKVTLLGGETALPLSRHFAGNPAEQLGYIGLPLVVITALAMRMSWSVVAYRPMIVTLLATWLLALGPQLKILGHGRLPLPWMLLEKLPLLNNALPSRLMIYAMLFIAVLCALWLSRLARFYLPACILVMGSALLMLPASRAGGSASGWYTPVHQSALFEDRLYKNEIAAGQSVLVMPFYGDNGNGDAMLWQTETKGYFRMVNGYGNFVPPGLSVWPAVDILRSTHAVIPVEPGLVSQFSLFMKSNDVRDVIVPADLIGKWDGFLQSAGWTGEDFGDLRLYRIAGDRWAALGTGDARAERLAFDESHLTALRQAAICMAKASGPTLDIGAAGQAHCLDAVYSPQPNDPDGNWDNMGGWLGHFDGGTAIGVTVAGCEVAALVAAQPGKAIKIYYPYRRVYHPGAALSQNTGQLLLVYGKDSLR